MFVENITILFMFVLYNLFLLKFMQEKRSFIPRWEETLIVDQPIKKVLKIQETNQNSDHLDDYGPVMFFLVRFFLVNI